MQVSDPREELSLKCIKRQIIPHDTVALCCSSWCNVVMVDSLGKVCAGSLGVQVLCLP